MVSQVTLFKNDVTGEMFETPLQAVDSEYAARHALHTRTVQRGAFAERTEDW